jgi:DNA-binding transcriptional regulator YdaS (Cro superfamily)
MSVKKSKSALKKAVKIAGGLSPLARAIGLKNHQNILYWLNTSKNMLPAKYAAPIEAVTNGQITKEMLRPDLFK